MSGFAAVVACSSQTLKKAISIACCGIRQSGVLLVPFFFFF